MLPISDLHSSSFASFRGAGARFLSSCRETTREAWSYLLYGSWATPSPSSHVRQVLAENLFDFAVGMVTAGRLGDEIGIAREVLMFFRQGKDPVDVGAETHVLPASQVHNGIDVIGPVLSAASSSYCKREPPDSSAEFLRTEIENFLLGKSCGRGPDPPKTSI